MEGADSSRKLSFYDPQRGWVPLCYPNTFAQQNISGVARLLIATADNSIELMRELLSFYEGPFQLVYLLVTPPEDQDPTRYEIVEVSQEKIDQFLTEFREFLSSDGRHHVWIHAGSGGTLILDEHDWVYAYGAQESISNFLKGKGFGEGAPELPFPHVHHERNDLDPELDRVLAWCDWKASRLS